MQKFLIHEHPASPVLKPNGEKFNIARHTPPQKFLENLKKPRVKRCTLRALVGSGHDAM
jgi:hypothetical protein